MSAVKKSAATHVYLPTGHRLGRYEVLVKLATGGMAVVYIGRAQGLAGFERLVALKVLHQNLAHEDEFVRMFLDEARLAARIRHPNVVPTIDISDTPETGFFIVMDYVEGDHLGALFAGAHKAGGPLAVPVTLRILADALAGLGAAHDLRSERGELLKLVHRDVSPHNIIVGSDGVARLTDFGVAKAENRLAHTRDGQLKGKLAYMAPEQAVRGSCDARSDLFAVGVILWEAVTGRRLFRADNPGATLHKLLHEPIVAPSAIDPALEPVDALLARALDRDPDHRFQSAEEFIDAIEKVAPKVGGLASLREVSTVVRQLTADKMRKEHELLELSKEALLLEAGVVLGCEDTNTSHVTSASDVSMGSMSLSRSKVSGVYSANTGTGMQIAAALPPPPLPAGMVASPDGLELESLRPSFMQSARRASPLLIVLATCLAIGLLVLGWMASRESASPVASALPSDEPSPADLQVEPAAESAASSPAANVGGLAGAATGEAVAAPSAAPSEAVRATPMPVAPEGAVKSAARAAEGKRDLGAATTRPTRGARAATGQKTPAKTFDDELLVNPYHR